MIETGKQPFPPEETLEIKRGDYTANLIHCSKKSFYDILRTKLNWGKRGGENVNKFI